MGTEIVSRHCGQTTVCVSSEEPAPFFWPELALDCGLLLLRPDVDDEDDDGDVDDAAPAPALALAASMRCDCSNHFVMQGTQIGFEQHERLLKGSSSPRHIVQESTTPLNNGSLIQPNNTRPTANTSEEKRAKGIGATFLFRTFHVLLFFFLGIDKSIFLRLCISAPSIIICLSITWLSINTGQVVWCY